MNKGARVPTLDPQQARRRLPDARAPRAARAHRVDAAPDQRPDRPAWPSLQSRIEASTEISEFLLLDREFHLLTYSGCRYDQPAAQRDQALERHPALPADLHEPRRTAAPLGGQRRARPDPRRHPPGRRRRRRALPERAHPAHPHRAWATRSSPARRPRTASGSTRRPRPRPSRW
nr:hypothetical protein [Angustibacter aerolatus]